jgi:glucosamine--fructose-6-phosphate aminotransferase (isomerizing)
VPYEVDYGSEFRYRDAIVVHNTLTIVISIQRDCRHAGPAEAEQGSRTLAICNVVGSMITRRAGTIYTHAGPEIGSPRPRHSPAS